MEIHHRYYLHQFELSSLLNAIALGVIFTIVSLPLRLLNHPNSQFQVTLNSSLLLAVALLTHQEKTQLVIIVKPRQVKYCGEKIKWFGNIYSLKS